MDENSVKNIKQVKHEISSPKKLWLNLNEFPEGEDLFVGKESSKVSEDKKNANGLHKVQDLNELSYAEQLKVSIEESNDKFLYMIYETYFPSVLGLKEMGRPATDNKEIAKEKPVISEKENIAIKYVVDLMMEIYFPSALW